jgi:hypothetical protein
MKETVRLNFEFPREEYPYLKMLCAQKGVSLKDLATELLIEAIEEYEDEQLALKANKRLEEMKDKESETVTWEEACRLAGWEDGHSSQI